MDQPPLVITSPSSSRQSLPFMSFYHFQRRCAVLQITQADLSSLHTIGDVQRLAKKRYRQLARHYHPDHQAQIKHCHNLIGTRFRKITRTYQWLMALPPSLLVPLPKTLSPMQLLPLNPEDILPWAFSRHITHIPYGYQEVPGYRWA